MANYKIFNGLRYRLAWEWRSKEEAEECAKGYRKDGYLAHIVTVRVGKRVERWDVYVHRVPAKRRAALQRMRKSWRKE